MSSIRKKYLHSIEANLYLQDWTHPETTGIGAGIDSFYEYALKWYILSGMSLPQIIILISTFPQGESEFLDVWEDAYAAIMRYSRAKDGYWVWFEHTPNMIMRLIIRLTF